MAKIEKQHSNYINITANTWTSLGSTQGGVTPVSPAGKAGSLYVSTTGGSSIAMSLDAGTTYHFMIPSNVVVDMGQIDPFSLHCRSASASQILTWWWVTE